MIHCLRCKHKTDTHSARGVRTQHGRKMIMGGCVACGARKSRFVRDGDGIFDSIGDFFKGAAHKVADVATNAAHKVASVAKTGYEKTIGDRDFQNGFKKGFGNTLGVLGTPAGAVINSFAPGVGSATGYALSHAGNYIAGNGLKRRRRRRGRGVAAYH